ncbi:MAG: riboflavin synthase [Candidatus Marinimicrobia bacterium]|nr:riboflavin synthase [Candidatus Neomarinimicrobiota bacterium]
MFTGIVEELGKVKTVIDTDAGKQFIISARLVMDDLKVGDSISVNGVCLTVIEAKIKQFKVDLVSETLKKSNLGEIQVGSKVNLERALTLSTRLGGHILQGHVESVGVIIENMPTGEGFTMVVGIDPEWMRYCIPKGSIALDGISLTIAEIEDNLITIALIPHTLEQTTLGIKQPGETLNVETDIVGKYIERLLSFEDDDRDEDSLSNRYNGFNYGES